MMQAQSAAELEELFEDAFAARDTDALVGLFEDGAVVLAPGGDQRRGRQAIAGLAEEFWTHDAAYVSEVQTVVDAGEVALVLTRWTLSGRDGTVADRGSAIDVARRQPDGTWKYVIGMPAGTS
jgi:uncharacterized protein (TIGR02246 family)